MNKLKRFIENLPKMAETIAEDLLDKPSNEGHRAIKTFYEPFVDENGKLTSNGLDEAKRYILDMVGGNEFMANSVLSFKLEDDGFPSDATVEQIQEWKANFEEIYGKGWEQDSWRSDIWKELNQ